MPTRPRHHEPKPVPIGRAEYGLSKLGAARFDRHDPYHMAVSLPWPGFILAALGLWLAINVAFALLYLLSPGSIANAKVGSFGDAFFFSVETLATVGYGVMAPATLFGHIVSAVEVVTGMAITAIVTGLLFVRFSRAKPHIVAAEDAVVGMQDGKSALMLRIVNGRITMMSGSTARLFLLAADRDSDGPFLRRIHELQLQQSHLPLFVMPWTLIHLIDEASPLHGHDAESLAEAGARLFLTIEVYDHALSAMVRDLKDYSAEHVRFGMRFGDMVRPDEAGGATADLSRISVLVVDDGFVAARRSV
ncbi:ion channel [Rhodopila sp.]|uniref:ion channel n=1 Tax=Rhodopila sp. TaxID=2480087 RepID=UPI003D0E7C1C